MNTNILYISSSSYGEYEEKLKILNKEHFELFIQKLRAESVDRNLSGMVHYECLSQIADTLIAFDEINFDDNYATGMDIRNLENLKQRSKLNMTEKEFLKWIFNGMINGVANIIDEDINYSVDDSFFKNLKDILCLINIRNLEQ